MRQDPTELSGLPCHPEQVNHLYRETLLLTILSLQHLATNNVGEWNGCWLFPSRCIPISKYFLPHKIEFSLVKLKRPLSITLHSKLAIWQAVDKKKLVLQGYLPSRTNHKCAGLLQLLAKSVASKIRNHSSCLKE